jgi:RNA polymerase sigma-70 factor (ECF subfamily)
MPGFVTVQADGTVQTTALEIGAGLITAIHVVRNPDKLRHVRIAASCLAGF